MTGTKIESSPSFTEAVVDAVLNIDFDTLRPDLLERARHCLLDWIGVTIAGSAEPTAGIARTIMEREGSFGVSTVLGSDRRLGAQAAAFANGIASHALDFDDSSTWALAHPSGPMLAALLALAEERGASGRRVLEAIVAGLQGQCMIGVATGASPYDKGFHMTGTMGAFGATVATAYLLGLDRERFMMALSLAATQAAGLMAVFGTMGKHLNSAKAAVAGVLSTELAEEGFTAPFDAIEARLGFEWTQSTTFDPTRVVETMGDTYGVESVVFKYFACCHDTHSAIRGVSAIRAERPFSIKEVERVTLEVSSGLIDVCAIPDPATGLEGKFSVRYACARALADEPMGVEGFTDAEVRRPDLIALRDRVDVVVASQGSAILPTKVTIRFSDGTERSALRNPLVPVGRDELPKQWNDLAAKFLPLTANVVGAERSNKLLKMIEAVEELHEISSLMELTQRVENEA